MGNPQVKHTQRDYCLPLHPSLRSLHHHRRCRRAESFPTGLPPSPTPPQPGAGKRLRNGHCFFGGEPQCCSLKHFNRRNSNTRREKEAGLRDKQNPPRHKPVPDFLPQPLFSSRVRVCFLIFFFSVKFTRGASADLRVFEQANRRPQ